MNFQTMQSDIVAYPLRLAIDMIELDLIGLDCRDLGRMGLAFARKLNRDLYIIAGTATTIIRKG